MRRMIPGLLVAATLAWAASAAPGAEGTTGWVKVADDGVGPRDNPGLVYAAQLKRLVVFGGSIYLWPSGGPHPYDVQSSAPGSNEWRNEYPAGKSFGLRVGPASAPDFKNVREVVDKEGNVRLNSRDNQMYFQYAFDPDGNAVWVLSRNNMLRLALDTMTWEQIKTDQVPGSDTELPLRWASRVYEPGNRELLLFGGADGRPQRDGASTWVFSTKASTW